MKMNNQFQQCVHDFLMIYLSKQKCCEKNTISSYRDTLNLLRIYMDEEKSVPFHKITFDLLTYANISNFIDWLSDSRGCSASTCNQRRACLCSFFKYAALSDPALMNNYMNVKKVSIKKVPKESVKHLSGAALKAIFEQPDIKTVKGRRNRTLLILLYDTGARISEILNLRIDDIIINLGSPCVYLHGKGNKTRCIPIFDNTLIHIKRYLEEFHITPKGDDYLFYTDIKGARKSMSEDNVSIFLKKYANEARKICNEIPKKIHCHLLRHTKAMDMYKSGIPLPYIKDFLGHTNLNTTNIYAYANLEMMRSALEPLSKDDNHSKKDEGIWKNNDDMILKLCGLK